jgi:TRAP-type uncharacterized transport system fused permease subunit
MFVFYFGVASAITPPVAVAAFAAAAISQASPLKTAFEATRIGLVIFILPFTFAFYPQLLLIPEAGGSDSLFDLVSIILRLGLAILLISSALARFDCSRLNLMTILARITLALGMLITLPAIHWSAFAAGIAVLLIHRQQSLKKGALA